MSDDTKEEASVQQMVEKMQEVFENKIEEFDKLLSAALNNEPDDCVKEFVEGYLLLRESGFDFDDAFNTAAEQIELEVPEDDEEDE